MLVVTFKNSFCISIVTQVWSWSIQQSVDVIQLDFWCGEALGNYLQDLRQTWRRDSRGHGRLADRPTSTTSKNRHAPTAFLCYIWTAPSRDFDKIFVVDKGICQNSVSVDVYGLVTDWIQLLEVPQSFTRFLLLPSLFLRSSNSNVTHLEHPPWILGSTARVEVSQLHIY